MMFLVWSVLYGIIGLAGVVYALNSHRVHFVLADHLPKPFDNRKVVFLAGMALALLGLGSSFLIGIHHNLITLPALWIVLLGSTPWFNKRAVRKFFSPEEMSIIRRTMLAGFIMVVLSTLLVFLSPGFSSGTFFMGLSVLTLAGRLWWNMDLAFESHVMVQSKRDYS
jgi:hypothetical protein